jgi:hypothetical protein
MAAKVLGIIIPPSLLARADERNGGCRRVSGRSGDVAATAALDPEPTFDTAG